LRLSAWRHFIWTPSPVPRPDADREDMAARRNEEGRMQNPVVLLNGNGLAFFHGIPFFFHEPADLGALSQKNMPLGCAKAGPHTGFIAPLLPKAIYLRILPRQMIGKGDTGTQNRLTANYFN
jgi:hypothetical protein